MSKWRMDVKCENCPFHEAGPGRHLRDSLNPGRFKDIADGLLRGEVFFCHKHVDQDRNGGDSYIPSNNDRVCAGAIEYQEQHGVVAQYVQVCTRLDQMRTRKKKG